VKAKRNVDETAKGERVQAKANAAETAADGRGCNPKSM